MTNNSNAATATASASYAESANYLGSSDTQHFTIDKAPTTTAVSCPAGPFTYTGAAQTPCSASVTGPGLSQSLTVNYTNNTSVGTATASATYTESANHLGSSDSKHFTIDKAPTTTAVSCAGGPFAYTGSAQTPCSATVTGPGLSQSRTVNYTNNTNAGTATASASYAESANYLGSSDSKPFTIGRATTTTTVTCDAGPFVYNGSAQTPCSATVTGPGGLNQTLTVNYTNNTNAGTATATATYPAAADPNYLGSSDSKTFTIGKAAATVTLSNLSYAFDGTPKSATATTNPVGLSVSLTYNGSATSPSAVGNYTVVATVNDPNYQGTATGTLTIGAWYATGFYAPVGADAAHSVFAASPGPMPASKPTAMEWNVAKGGSTVPLKFNLYTTQGGAERTNTADVQAFAVVLLSCAVAGTEDPVDFTTTGSTSLRYDTTDHQFIQNWKTPNVTGDSCYRTNVKFIDGSVIYAFFKLKR
jgi:hypothetical protein